MRLIHLPATQDTKPMLINPDLITAVIRRSGKIDVYLSGTHASVTVWDDNADKLWDYLCSQSQAVELTEVDLGDTPDPGATSIECLCRKCHQLFRLSQASFGTLCPNCV